jgi:hypothetical protein
LNEQERILRAKRVARLLEDQDFKAAMQDIQSDIFAEWAHARNEQERESLHAVHRATQRLRAKLQTWADELLSFTG